MGKIGDICKNPEKRGKNPRAALNITLTTGQAAELFGVTPKTVIEWGKTGAPKADHGTWLLKDLFDWWKENIAPRSIIKKHRDETKAEADRRRAVAKARREEIALEKEEKTHCKLKDVEAAFFSAGRIVRDAMLNIPDRVKAELAAESDAFEIGETLTKEIRAALEDLAEWKGIK